MRRTRSLAAVHKLAHESPDEPGMVLYQAHRDPQNPRVFFFYEQYVDEAAYGDHVELRALQALGLRRGDPAAARAQARVLRDHLMAEYQITYWRDLPSLVVAREGDVQAKTQLAPRFQEAIDEAAMRLGDVSSGDYLDGWRRDDWAPGDGAPSELAAQGRGAARGGVDARGDRGVPGRPRLRRATAPRRSCRGPARTCWPVNASRVASSRVLAVPSAAAMTEVALSRRQPLPRTGVSLPATHVDCPPTRRRPRGRRPRCAQRSTAAFAATLASHRRHEVARADAACPPCRASTRRPRLRESRPGRRGRDPLVQPRDLVQAGQD